VSITINCKISLSKKLRALLGKEGTINLSTSNLTDGRGLGKLSLMTEEELNTDISSMPETAIMITPIDIADEMPDISNTQSSIFSTIAPKGKEDKITRKIAAVNAPEKEEIHKAIVEEVEIPDVFKVSEECKNWIDDMENLLEIVNLAKQKQSKINPEEATNTREKALLIEEREREEAIGIPAWIVCDTIGSLSINDLGISLTYNVPFNLGNVSARRIAISRDLRSLLNQGYIKFISPAERQVYLNKAVEAAEHPGLEVFSHHDEAEASITNMSSAFPDSERQPGRVVIDEENAMEVNENNAAQLGEEESMIINLTQNMPTVKTQRSQTPSKQPTHTVHGNTNTPTNSNPPQPKFRRAT
jgi:hypothetical protein